MQQVIEWIEITKETPPPHRDIAYFLKKKYSHDDDAEIVTGYYHHYDGQWVIVDPMQELTFKLPLYEFTHYARVEA
jgi:hypothetical protein